MSRLTAIFLTLFLSIGAGNELSSPATQNPAGAGSAEDPQIARTDLSLVASAAAFLGTGDDTLARFHGRDFLLARLRWRY